MFYLDSVLICLQLFLNCSFVLESIMMNLRDVVQKRKWKSIRQSLDKNINHVYS